MYLCWIPPNNKQYVLRLSALPNDTKIIILIGQTEVCHVRQNNFHSTSRYSSDTQQRYKMWPVPAKPVACCSELVRLRRTVFSFHYFLSTSISFLFLWCRLGSSYMYVCATCDCFCWNWSLQTFTHREEIYISHNEKKLSPCLTPKWQ